MCGSLLSKFKKSRKRIKSSSDTYFQDRRRETNFDDHPKVVQMRGLIKKMLEEHEKTKIKAPRSTSKRNEKTRSKSKTKETTAKKETGVLTAEFETGSSHACLPFSQVVKASKDITNCTDNCHDSKVETGAKKDPHAMEMRRSPAEGYRLLPIIHRSTITIQKVKEMAKEMAREEERLKKRKTKKVAKRKSTGEAKNKEKFASKINPRTKSCSQKMTKQMLCTQKPVMQKCTHESLAKEMLPRKQLISKRLTKEKSHTEGLQVQTFDKEKKCDKTVVYNRLLVGEKSSSSKSSPTSNKMASKPLNFAYTILLGRTKSAIAFKVLTDGKRKETVLLSARVPKQLRKLDNPPKLTAEMMAEKQLAVQEKRLRELERVRNCARACAQPVKRNTAAH